MVHGWMDVSASFQFVVDHLESDWHVIAPDWRGYGLTEWPATDCYWFPDYLADLDAILDHVSADAPVNLVGHSMGGNVSMLYAGARPERVGRLVNLEGFGLPGNKPDEAPARYARWLSELRERPVLKTYASQADVIERLRKTNPRLTEDRAHFLSSHWAEPTEAGWRIRGDAAHKVVNPVLYRVEEVMACWRAITAPVLWIDGKQSDIARHMGTMPDFADRLATLRSVRRVELDDAGHMLHHDRPHEVARLIEHFFG